jgi:hypothetical protein
VGIGEVDSALGQLINVRSDGPWRFAQTTDPVVHVVHGKKKDIGLIGSRSRLAKYGKKSAQDY